MNIFTFLRKHPRVMRISASLAVITFLGDVVYPTAAWALTSGPAQPEFTSFEPVVTTNMVNDFTGDLTYNLPVLQIPGPNGGGYALSLSYHSGTSPEEESSWVGYGWTLNPGAINRQMRGVPDDWSGANDERIKQWNKAIPNRTVSVDLAISDPEGFSLDIPISAHYTQRYNNYNGFGYSAGVGLVLADGIINVGFNVTDGEGSFSLQVNPAAILSSLDDEAKAKSEKAKEEFKKLKPADQKVAARNYEAKQLKDRQKNGFKPNLNAIANAYGMSAIEGQTYPLNAAAYTGASYTLGIGFIPAPSPLQIGISLNATGRYTTQSNQESSSPVAYGYLYTGQMGSGDASSMMDYHAENLTTYNKRDKFLQVPINDADIFSASGEGIAGSMRLYNRRNHPFRPVSVESTTDLYKIGGEIELGLNNGGGLDFQLGEQRLKVQGWNHNGTGDPTDEPYFFRMTNDMGGYVEHTGYEEPENAHVTTGGYSAPAVSTASLGERSARSSYVGFSTNGEMMDVYGSDYYYRRYEKNDHLGINRGALPQNQIGELSVLNGQGQRYNYGLPVMVKNEKNLSFSVPSGVSVIDASKAYTTSTGPQHHKRGTENLGTYASAYLLTSITDPDYVDRFNDGPDRDDVGGWTRFAYDQAYSSSAPYHWRMPYNGYTWQGAQLSECHDDLLGFSSGDKEIYFLDSIVTRTHVAVFRKSPRTDAKSAAQDPAAGGIGAVGGQTLEQLDRIDLYIRDAQGQPTGKPIKTVRFQYENEAWPGTPNSTAGKLTLKRVWFEYNGVVNAKITPYQFEYQYPTDPYPSPYTGVTDISSEYAGPNEIPSFAEGCNDPWGTYRADAAERAKHMRPWIDQTLEPTSFDPAAWQMKVIKLPSGGEIHIQYEPDDYAFVQNEHAHAMCRLDLGDSDHDVFNVRLTDLVPIGTTLTYEEKQRIVQIVVNEYKNGNKKMGFKFLYRLKDSGTFAPDKVDIGVRNQEFIDGYVTIKDAYLNSNDNNLLTLHVAGGHGSPKKVCGSLFNAEKRGKDLSGCTAGDPTEGSDALQIVSDFVAFAESVVSDPCTQYDPEHCYLRIPVPTKKVGGGLRVKRLLMCDPVEIGDPEMGSVYGSEYIYKIRDEYGMVVSSGVATNEPSMIRMENILVRPLDRFHQSWINRAISGRDKKQSEGPLGEGLYPSPSVGYRQVLVQSIHHDHKTSPAFTVKQFYTAKEYPVGWEQIADGELGADMTSIDEQHFELNLMTGLFNRIINKTWLSQGLAIKLNSMHGAMKSEATYSGTTSSFIDPEATLPYVPAAKQTETVQEYFKPGELIPVQTDRKGTIGHLPLGKEVDVTTEDRSVIDKLDDGTLEIDLDVGIMGVFAIPFFSAMPGLTFSNNEVHTHTVTKVISYPNVLRRTKIYQDGIYHITENIAFDRYSGEPIQVRTSDGFLRDPLSATNLSTATEGTYTKYSLPATYVYPGMGQVAKGERKMLPCGTGVSDPMTATFVDGVTDHIRLEPNLPGGSLCDALNAMCIGDLLELTNGSPALHYLAGISTGMDGGGPFARLDLEPCTGSPTCIPGYLSNIEIVRSGCDNELAPRAAEYTVYADGGTNVSFDQMRLDFVASLNASVLAALANINTPQVLNPQPDPLLLFEDQYAPFDPAGYALTNVSVKATSPSQLVISFSPRICEKESLIIPAIPASPNAFQLGPDGYLYFIPAGMDCGPVKVDCPQFLNPFYPALTIDKVVTCQASTFAHDMALYDPQDANTTLPAYDLEAGRTANWRMESAFAYNESALPSNANYNTGYYSMTQYDWDYPTESVDNWVRTSTVTQYSPDGAAAQELNALGISSCTKFGYDRTLPYLIAQNATLEQVHFESFEKMYASGTEYEDGLPTWSNGGAPDNTVAHSGKVSLKRSGQPGSMFVSKTIPNASGLPGGLVVKLWARSQNTTTLVHKEANLSLTFIDANNNANYESVTFEPIARSGEWVLWQGQKVPSWQDVVVRVYCVNVYPWATWVDDVRIQPAESQMTTYVYDPATFRLLTSFDDQHFGLYYQYNAEGKLIRKQIETERGLKTVQETQYNTPATERIP